MQGREYGKVVWPPEALDSFRLRKMFTVAIAKGEEGIAARIEGVLAQRHREEEMKQNARKYGPDMAKLLLALRTQLELRPEIGLLLEKGWAESLVNLLKLVEATSHCNERERAVKAAKNAARVRLQQAKKKIDAQRPKGLAAAQQQEGGEDGIGDEEAPGGGGDES